MLISSPQSTASPHVIYAYITVTFAFHSQACGMFEFINKAAVWHPDTELGMPARHGCSTGAGMSGNSMQL